MTPGRGESGRVGMQTAGRYFDLRTAATLDKISRAVK
jgi:hypothetical protein